MIEVTSRSFVAAIRLFWTCSPATWRGSAKKSECIWITVMKNLWRYFDGEARNKEGVPAYQEYLARLACQKAREHPH